MGRSKKNWDHLVDKQGNYGIDIINGLFPGSDGNSIKGTKGKDGEKGDKGQKGYQGDQGIKGNAGRPGLDGAKGEVGGDSTVPGPEGPEGQKGEQGDKGDEAVAPILTFKGAVGSVGVLPDDGSQTVGDTYFVTDKSEYYAWDGAQWVEVGNAIKGEKGPRGEKGFGEKGDRGPEGEKGATGNDGLAGTPGADGAPGKDAYEVAVDEGFTGTKNEWLESLKGEPGGAGGGSVGDAFDQDAYYDKQAINQLIDGHETPERAFDYYFSGEYPDNKITNADFSSPDRNNHLYDLGSVIVDGFVKNAQAPVFTGATKVLVINYALNDPLGSRSSQYEVLQFVYAREAENKFEGYVRRAKPQSSQFTDWRPATFNDGLYYTKRQVDDLFAAQGAEKDYVIRPQLGDDLNEAKVQLHVDGTAGADDTDVVIRGENGIAVSRKDGKIVIDGDGLNGIKYVGPINPADDPAVVKPDAEVGEFFIFSIAGTAVTGDTVGAGDWIIYSGPGIPSWKVVFVGGENGVLTVTATGALEQSGTATDPVIHLDPDKYVEVFDLPTILQPYAEVRHVLKAASLRRLGTLSDVEAGTDLTGPGGSFATHLEDVPNTVMNAGEYSVNLPEQELTLAQNDQYVRSIADMFDAIEIDATELVIRDPENTYSPYRSKVLEKSFDGKQYTIKFDNLEALQRIEYDKVTFLINHSYGFETPDGSFLRYDETLNKWYPSPDGGVTEEAADAKYVAIDGEDTSITADKIEINADTVEVRNKAGDSGTAFTVFDHLSVAGQGRLFANEGSFQNSLYAGTTTAPFVGVSNNAVVTVRRLQIALDNLDLSGGGGGGGSFDGETITLKNTMSFNDDAVNFAQFRAIGTSSKSFSFVVQTGALHSDVKTILTLQNGRANFNGARLSNITDPQSPSDALNLKAAEAKFLPFRSSEDLSLSTPALHVSTDHFLVQDSGGTKFIEVAGGNRVKLKSPRSTQTTGASLVDSELTPKWFVDSAVGDLKTELTADINTKTEEAPKNGKQYARKDGGWNEVIIPDADLSNLVEEAPRNGKEYGRKNGDWVALTSTTSVGNLPASPNRGTIYLTNGNVLAIGL